MAPRTVGPSKCLDTQWRGTPWAEEATCKASPADGLIGSLPVRCCVSGAASAAWAALITTPAPSRLNQPESFEFYPALSHKSSKLLSGKKTFSVLFFFFFSGRLAALEIEVNSEEGGGGQGAGREEHFSLW